MGQTFLDLISEDDLAALSAGATQKRYRNGAVLFDEGQGASDVLVILDGTIKLTKANAARQSVVLELRGRGELIGELSALDGDTRSATATVIGDVAVLAIDNQTFAELVRTRHSFGLTVQATLIRRVREAAARQLEQSALDSFGRTCSRLAELCDRFGARSAAGYEIQSPLSQQELASWICVSRDAVVRSLTKARTLGWLETSRRGFIIHDLEALRTRGSGITS